MRPDADWSRLIDGIRRGDEEVLAEFYREFGAVLRRVADRHIADGLRRRFGAESVVHSACRSFLRRAGEARFTLSDGEDLWRLLCAITLNKVRQQARFHTRERREVGRERAALPSDGATDPADGEPDPGEALALAEQLEHVLARLSEEERRIVDMKLQGRSNAEVAEALGCSERTVRRLLAELRERLEHGLSG